MGMKVVEPKLVQQRLFNNLVREQELLYPHCFQQPAEGPRKMPIDENSFTIHAVTCEVRDIIFVVHATHSPAQSLDDVEKNQVVDIIRFVSQLFLKIHLGPS